ncbi:hypothetical protein EJ03DRAFT_325807 [Teratosphaeria nubilosa]|uniref:Ribosomal protein S36, mitochondrial n=1 Tax=Teratosphaeria nubilosa TaxID=161662 RepID=A0A6G1LFN1_9PEZI|nr:hypothetical protein EJ03DRAFT_325807 [Teratosphaeria nubilosa]
MQATRALLQHRTPMIRFLGKRSVPKQIDHTPKPHPAAPSDYLPESFALYRDRATQHGPLNPSSTAPRTQSTASSPPSGSAAAQTSNPYGAIGGHSARELGQIRLGKGEVWDRNELPKRFHRIRWSEADIEALESGGASMYA